ncbi:hypothetical protein Ddye_010085 [Dipteronia dyeriana]|uniref:Protein kinase domain-containing protein n=1 Tax=Dipteronia dyeriana TaxID=168575 RepID=A0AAD9XCW8_9ROSI|nr:hypothetical protein Ddye_010085 [Dipteronia dyeriana]
MTAQVGDFGLAKFLSEASNSPSKNQPISVGLKGSIGYIPLEYMGGQVSILGDIYSYGVLLMEMFTGKGPTDSKFEDDLSIYNFVLMALPNHVMDIIDPSMLFEEENDEEISPNHKEEKAVVTDNDPQVGIQSREIEEHLVSVMRIGLACSSTSPRERMPMEDILKNLYAIRDSFLRSSNRNRRRLR